MSRKSKWGRRSRKPWRKLGLSVIFLLSAFIVYRIFVPSYTHLTPEWKGMDKPIFFADEVEKYSAAGTGASLSLPLPVIQAKMDRAVRYEKETESVIMATDDKLVRVRVGNTQASLNNAALKLKTAPSKQGEVVYVPVDLLEQIYGIQVEEDKSSGAVRVFMPGESMQHAIAKPDKRGKTSPLRLGASIHSPIVADVPPEAHLRILNREGDWYYAQMDSGETGFIRTKLVTPGEKEAVPKQQPKMLPAVQAWQNKRINMTWEAVYQVPANPKNVGSLPGINVVSPTWFELADAKGNVKSKGDANYVKSAHSEGMQVWGVYSNSFSPDLTTPAFATFETRTRAIKQLLGYAKQLDLDGINIDFENVKTTDGDNITQFMRELRPLARAQGLVVSMDVTPKSDSELWSKFLDRRALSEVIDYMALMAYDEHWAASPVAGSVASLPWTEAALNKILTEDAVPPSKLILGVPLYTRVWTETAKEGETKVSSKAIGMSKAQSIIQQYGLKPEKADDTGQNFVQYKEDGAVKKIWLEDKDSLSQRVALVKNLHLAGIASWTRSFGSTEAWTVLGQVNGD
ncbi:glycosyl hydrolase [Paenibacillus yonginensis]|uniref:Glycosyl hydrolase n=1 Tax=Paenibacillus yonginensis TaxID=1462996 RepID=A0A1B1N302_9BACL|nr:glycosyl hydrolase family 18 protein [Paenibacillus yonginensis]ANS75800.1 glycosyl hydrolase [Paenibacillus yonginensis]